MNRDDIIRSYRQRIAQGVRTRLTSADLEGLIQAFIDRLKSLDDRSAIDQLCQDEIALLEEGYPQATVAKNYIPRYRKAILAATEAGVLPLTQNTLLDYDYSKRNGDRVHFHGHYAYRAMKYDQEYTAIAEQDNARNNLKQDNLKPVNLERYLEAARALLASRDHNDLAVGIAAVTGRRFSEVVQNRFSKTDDPFTLRFAGQLKKREEAEAYNTLCLIPAAEVWKAIGRFRKLERIQDLQGLTTQQINAHMNKSVQRVAHRQFGESGIVPTIAGETATTIHNLRSVYAIAAIHLFCPSHQADHRFLQEQLGHVIGQRNLQILKNSPSTAHYFHYFLTDDKGKHIGDKGVLLEAEATIATETLPVDLPAIEPDAKLTAATQTQVQPAQPETLSAPTTATPSETHFMDALAELSNTIGFLRREAELQNIALTTFRLSAIAWYWNYPLSANRSTPWSKQNNFRQLNVPPSSSRLLNCKLKMPLTKPNWMHLVTCSPMAILPHRLRSLRLLPLPVLPLPRLPICPRCLRLYRMQLLLISSLRCH